MAQNTDTLIAGLVDELQPVRPLLQRRGMLLAVLALLAGTAIIAFGFGLRHDILSGRPDPMFLIASGLLLVLALASAWAVIDMARPYVGTHREGWWWTALMAAVLPAAALMLILFDLAQGHHVALDRDGIDCFGLGAGVGTLTAMTLVLWLRQGAPSNPKLAGLLTGVGAGASGIFAVSLYCPHNGLLHIGVWHAATVIAMGLAGRMALPRVLAW